MAFRAAFRVTFRVLAHAPFYVPPRMLLRVFYAPFRALSRVLSHASFRVLFYTLFRGFIHTPFHDPFRVRVHYQVRALSCVAFRVLFRAPHELPRLPFRQKLFRDRADIVRERSVDEIYRNHYR